MVIPVQCFTCGKNIACNMEAYQNSAHKNATLTRLGYKRYCCRRMFITHIHTSHIMNTYYKKRCKDF